MTIQIAADVDALYRTLSPRLEQLVRSGTRAPRAAVEDACQFAWGQLLLERDVVDPGTVLPWLAQTATRELQREARRGRRCDSDLEASPAETADPRRQAELRLRLDGIRRLPARQQRVLWLQALGLSYEEIARVSGCTRRTVERQVLRARRRLRQLDAG